MRCGPYDVAGASRVEGGVKRGKSSLDETLIKLETNESSISEV